MNAPASRRTVVFAGVGGFALLALAGVQLGFLVRLDSAIRRAEKKNEVRHQGIPTFLAENRSKIELSDSLEQMTAGRSQRIAAEYGLCLRRPIVQRLGADRATLVWETGRPAPSRLVYGPGGGESRTFEDPELRLVHEVELDGLAPDTVYEGEVAGGTGFSFRTYPERFETLRIAVVSDTQGGSAIERVASRIREREPHLLLHCGDLVNNGMRYSHWREEFFLPDVLDLLGRVPIYPVLGNHEFDAPIYYAYFSLPGEERWYSFEVGPARFFALDTNIDVSPGSVQHRWLEASLQAARDVPWRIAYFHHSPYGAELKNDQHSDGGRRVRAHLAPLFEKYGVQLVFTGHEHGYVRSRPLGPTTYVIAGGGGPLGYPKADPEYAAVNKNVNHFLLLEATADRLVATAIDVEGNEIDRFELGGRAAE